MAGQRISPLAMIEKLVGFDTTSRNSNLDLIGWIADYLAGHGIGATLVHNDDGTKANLFATLGPEADGGIVLSGHTDVVPVDGQDWQSDPWRVVEQGGRLYGRGTADMKSFSAIALALAPEFLARGLTTPIHFALSYDEEVGCTGVKGLLGHLRQSGRRPRAVIVGEPTDMEVVDAHKTGVLLTTTVHGLEYHSSKTHRGVNAIFHAMALIRELDRIAERFREEDSNERFDPPYSTLSVNVIDGGSAGNIIPAECTFFWEMRTLPDRDAHGVLRDFERYATDTVLPMMRHVWDGARIETEMVSYVPGLVPDHGSVAETLALALTESNQTFAVSYGTEAGLFQELGIPTVVCGPGNIEQAHKPDEFIELAQVEACERFLRRLMDRVCET